MPFAHYCTTPVDVHELCRSNGIAVVERPQLPESGKTYWCNSRRQWVIEVRADESSANRRLAIAQELGRFCLHYRQDANSEAKPGHVAHDALYPLHEHLVNAFAADLLMPETIVSDLWRKDPSVENLARSFCVSRAALRWRLHNLGLRRMH